MRAGYSAFSALVLSALALWAAPASGGEPPALQQLADELARRVTAVLHDETSGTPIVAVVVEGDQAILGQEGRIAQELERLLVFRLQAGTAVERVIPLGSRQGAQALDQARLRGATWLLQCVFGLKKDSVYLTADLTPAHVPFWDRLVDPVPRGSQHHLFVSAGMDEEIGLLLGKSRAPPSLGNWHMDELLYVPRRVLDLGLGDLDGDGGGELVLMYEDSIEVFSFSGGEPQRLAGYDLAHVPREKKQTRDPVGGLLVTDFNNDGRFEVFYKHFNRRWGEILSWTGARLRPVRKLRRIPLCQFRHDNRPVVLYGSPESGTNRYRSGVELVDVNASSGEVHELQNQFSSLRCFQREGHEPWIVVVDSNGDLSHLGGDWRVESTVKGVGAGAGVLDLDLDGRPDLVLSEPVWPGDPDSLRVVSQGEVVWRSTDVVGGVVAVAGGDLSGTGKIQAVVAAVEPGGKASRIYLLGR